MIEGCPTPGCDLVVGRLGDTAWWGCADGHRTRTPLRDAKLPDIALLSCPSCGQRFRSGAVMAHDMVTCPRCQRAKIRSALDDVRRVHMAELRKQLAEPDPFGE